MPRLLSDDSLGLVYCDTEVIGPAGEVLHKSYWELHGFSPHRGPGALAEIVGYWGNVAMNSTIMFRAELAAEGHRPRLRRYDTARLP